MPEQRRAGRTVGGILVGGAIIVAIAVGFKTGFFGAWRLGGAPFGSRRVALTVNSPLAVLNAGVRDNDPQALVFLRERVTPKPEGPPQAMSEQAAAEWLETLSSLRKAFPRLGASGRATAVAVACRIL